MSRPYYTLIASLPPMPVRFDQERLPISSARLVERLKMLEPDDAAVVEAVRLFLYWDRSRRPGTDAEVIAEYDRLMGMLRNHVAREIVEFRMDIRTILSGLRRRHRGLSALPGVGIWADHIQRHWQQRDFALGWRFPWIETVDSLLGTDRVLEIHRVLLDHAWRHWRRAAENYVFGFETLLLYLARWEIMARWTSLDAVGGQSRFEKLFEEATREHRELFN